MTDLNSTEIVSSNTCEMESKKKKLHPRPEEDEGEIGGTPQKKKKMSNSKKDSESKDNKENVPVNEQEKSKTEKIEGETDKLVFTQESLPKSHTKSATRPRIRISKSKSGLKSKTKSKVCLRKSQSARTEKKDDEQVSHTKDLSFDSEKNVLDDSEEHEPVDKVQLMEEINELKGN